MAAIMPTLLSGIANGARQGILFKNGAQLKLIGRVSAIAFDKTGTLTTGVVEYAPQLELLQQATLTITHAGMNTTLESLANGVPMVAIPIANDQPGVAARIAWTGTGEVVPLKRLSPSELRGAIQRLLSEETYRQNALRLQAAIRRAGGVKTAIDIVEQAIATGKPVHC